MTQHKVGSREDWLDARNELLDQVPEGRGDEIRARRHDEYEDVGA